MPTRVVIAIDSKVCRDGVSQVISGWNDIEVVADTGNGREAVELVAKMRPDVALVETTLPGLNGIEVARLALVEHPALVTIMLSMHADGEMVTRTMQGGARAYVLASGGTAELRAAFDAVLAGRTYLSQDAETALITSLVCVGANSPGAKLSRREQEVLQLLAEGASTKEIAVELKVSIKTVETHRRNVMRKLAIHSIAGLTKFAIRSRLTTLGVAVAIAIGYLGETGTPI